MPKKSDWNPFALLLIDVQNDFWSDELPVEFPQFPENVARLLSFCRAEGIEVIHLRSFFDPDMSDWMERYRLRKRIPCVAGTAGAEVLPFASELPGEKVIVKHTFDGFLAPDLLPYLEQNHKRFLLTAGLITSTCVLFTTTSAMQHGFLTAVVEDCCADGPARHETTLDTYPYIFERVTVDLLAAQNERWNQQLGILNAYREKRT
jgi:ureidoacrylate peracid hydrolase